MNLYKKAVDFLEDYIECTEAIYNQPSLEGMESRLQFAIKILKEQDQYGIGIQ